MKTEIIFGINAVENLFKLAGTKPVKLLLRKGKDSSRFDRIIALAEGVNCAIERVPERQLDNLTDTSHQGVALEVGLRKSHTEDELYDIAELHKGSLLFLVLDGVTDPRNLGACIRSAATLGAHAVIVPKDKSAPLNEAAAKTASGAADYVPLIPVTNLARTLGKLQKMGVWIVGTLLETELTIDAVDMTGDIALVLGSEEKGLRHNTIQHCDYLAKIPMQNESFGFNVSVAAGICLYEAARQKRA